MHKRIDLPPSLDRIVSSKLTEEQRQELVTYFTRMFNDQEIAELSSGEVPLTKEQKFSTALANSLANRELSRYDIYPINVPDNNVHIFDDKQIEQLGERHGFSVKNIDAVTSFFDQAIILRDKPRNIYNFLSVVLHEMFHLKSYTSLNSVQISKDEIDKLSANKVFEDDSDSDEDFIITNRRQGWNVERIRKGGRNYFHHVDEAIVEELTVKTVRDRGVEIFGDEFKSSEKLRQIILNYIRTVLANEKLNPEDEKAFEDQLSWFENGVMILLNPGDFLNKYEAANEDMKIFIILDAIDHYVDETNRNDRVTYFHYGNERKFFNRLIRTLWSRNKDDFASENEIWVMFVKAGFDGNIMPVARLVEKTFGKGSFRKLGKGVDVVEQ